MQLPNQFLSTISIAASLSLFSGLHAQDNAPTDTPKAEPTAGKILQQAQIKGLLVIQLSAGKFAGGASQMNATVVKSSKEFELGFNQKVGDLMKKATVEVDKFIRVRYAGKLPSNTRVEFSFADKYSPKDGPSAAVVCALMVDSILSGMPLTQISRQQEI